MQKGAYSMQYTMLTQQDDMSRDREKLALNMQRSRRMQFETSKRRKAIAAKRRQDTDREEQRRQEILARRREGIKSATEKYQRLNKHYVPKTDSEIKAQLHANQSHAATPALEDALRAVRGSSHYRSGSTGSIPHNGAGLQGTSATLHGPIRAQHDNRYLQGAHTYYQHVHQNGGGTAVAGRRVQSAVTRTDNSQQRDLHNNSLRNMTNSRTLFEQQLEHQQSQLAVQQQDMLQNFSSAVNQELNNKPSHTENGQSNHAQVMHVHQNGANNMSTCSVDSLEGGANNQSLSANQMPVTTHAYTYNQSHSVHHSKPTASVTPSNAVTFASHRPSNSPVAVVTPSIKKKKVPTATLR